VGRGRGGREKRGITDQKSRTWDSPNVTRCNNFRDEKPRQQVKFDCGPSQFIKYPGLDLLVPMGPDAVNA